ncbi:MAG TPA: glycoside hydrolase family 2 TIM barrel-domain containing protein [Terriglobales bacterium]|nr:glycoside hydrolase family 2 TIM barrel-domain containing protein [Terriglobales bacterium]
MADLPGRSTISLDGTWNTIVDPYESGLNSRYFEKARPHAKGDLVEFDFDHSPKLHVPGDWNTQRDSLFFYEGPLWYQRNFSYQKRPHTRAFLYFGAANYLARVWLNGVRVGEHVGGFTPFDFEVTGQLSDGDNSVVVEVDNTRRPEGVPSVRTDWWNYGGLTRSVKLIEVPETFIENYSVHPAKGQLDQIEGWVQLNGAQPAGTVTVEIPELRISQKAQTNRSGRAEFRFPAKVEAWSPERPRLYKLLIASGEDSITGEAGFRTIETRGTQILLNGEPAFLRGINIHEEAPYRGGRAFSEEDARTLLTWAKELGCNFVRLAHYPHNENMVRLADQLGLLVWEEVPVYWDIQWENPATLENAKAQLRDVVRRDQNRASVILWSLSNETPVSPARNAFLKALAEYARNLDPTRLITSASDRFDRSNPQSFLLNDPLGEYLDVLGVNEYVGWYYRKPEDADQIQWKPAYAKPVIVSEFGADALYNLHGDAETRFTEEYQANLYAHQLRMISRIPGLAGIAPWILMDFHSPRRPLPGIQDYFNRKGLVSDRGQRKQAFYLLQKFYRGEAESGPQK